MVFSSIEFLFYFLPAVILAYYLTPKVATGGSAVASVNRDRWRNMTLLAFSLLFYAWGAGWLIVILLVSVMVNYFAAKLIDRAGSRIAALRWLVAALVFNILLLAYYKYANFFMSQLIRGFNIMGFNDRTGWTNDVLLPIGISFYTFHAISYIVDIYRRVSRPKQSFGDFLLYMVLFPQLIAGPIIRYNRIETDIDARCESFDLFARGALRFGWGLFKKIMIADQVGAIVDAAFGMEPGTWGAGTAWIAVLAYTLQIYFDFSAYSDMAIGMGMMFGFRFPENFDRPYSAVSLTDFWRRWHMTLSNWFRDYVYIPIGGSRTDAPKVYRNLLAVFFLTGLWHGAAWNFVLWGLYHGGLLMLERASGLRSWSDERLVWPRRALTALLVMIGWVMFRTEHVPDVWDIYRAMFSFQDWSLPVPLGIAMSHQAVATLIAASLVFLLPRDFVAGRLLAAGEGRLVMAFRMLVLFVLLPLALCYAMNQSFSPFLYYQF